MNQQKGSYKQVGLLAFGLSVASLAATADVSGRLNVRDFGASGDGTSDDTRALQLALDKANDYRQADVNSWGGYTDGCAVPEVLVPKGVYRLTRPLVATRTVALRGERGAVIEAAGVVGPALYVDRAYRCTVDGLTFRNGESHIAFWTHNDDTAAFLIKNCRFVNASQAAVWTESWRRDKFTTYDITQESTDTYVAPYKITRDESGLPVLTPLQWTISAANSTRFTLHDCNFLDCAAAYRGSTDGQYVTRVQFRSSKEQTLPVFMIRGEVQLTDVRIQANIPKGFAYGYIDGSGGGGNYVLTRVRAETSSACGAPLLGTDRKPRSESGQYASGNHIDVLNCTADVDGATGGAFLDFRNREPALLHVRGSAEAKGRRVRLLRIGNPPTDLAAMRDVDGFDETNTALEMTHRWLFEENGASLDETVPAILKACLESSLPAAATARFPPAEARIVAPTHDTNTVIRAADYGIGLVRAAVDETDALERLFRAAAAAENPIVELPGRTIAFSRTLPLPRRVGVRGAGRAILRGLTASNDVFRVVDGSGPIAISFDNVGLVRGRFALVAEGAGRIHFSNGILTYNRGFALTERGGLLDASVIDSTVYSPQVVENNGATFRMRDCWIEFMANKDVYTLVVNRRGTVLLERILGVPVTASNPIILDRIPGLPEGEYIFWIRNEGGVVRTREVRYGGEFGGVPVLDNYGDGRALLEQGASSIYNKGGVFSIYRNDAPEAEVTVNRVFLYGVGWTSGRIGIGVRPKGDWRSGMRTTREDFVSKKNQQEKR